MNQDKNEIVPTVIDLNIAKNGQINEIFLQFWGDVVKGIMLRMFGASKPKLYSPYSGSDYRVRGTPSQIKAFGNALQSEKSYIKTYQKYGLDDPKTHKNKAFLKRSISKFERETGLKWPFK
jgi:hypothetical protein